MIAKVIIDIPNFNIDNLYSYLIPTNLIPLVKRGIRVSVKFSTSNILRTGFILDITDEIDPNIEYKSIINVIDTEPIINEEIFSLINYVNKINISSYYNCIKTIIPNELSLKYTKQYLKGSNFNSDSNLIFNKNNVLKNIKDISLNKLNNLIKNNELVVNYQAKTKTIPQVSTYKLNTNISLNIYDKYPILNDLGLNNTYNKDYLLDLGFSDSSIKTLVKKNVLIETKQDKVYDSYHNIVKNPKDIVLNKDQEVIFNTIKNSFNTNSRYLLHGVTGSGKTEIYIKLIKEVLNNNQNVLLLSPQITLITPLLTRILSEFDNVDLFHSSMSSTERLQTWSNIKNNKSRLVLGTRSACFLPLTNIGLIIMDEEHDESYLQKDNINYSTKEILKLRSTYHNCPLILASATPLITSYYEAINNELILLELRNKAINTLLPKMSIVDIRLEDNKIISHKLLELIKEKINKNEQVILLHNVKAYSKSLKCVECGYVVKCDNCDVSLSYYKSSNKLRCHYCGFSKDASFICPSCGGELKINKPGIELVYQELIKLLPSARILVADTNNITTKSDYENIYTSFYNHEYDILLGTQMISKGLDFPRVTLSAVINADDIFNLPNYNAIENAYFMFVQLIGRSSRFIMGDALIQTTNPNHLAITSLKYNYLYFYERALKSRYIGGFEPYFNLAQIIIKSSNLQIAFSIAKDLVIKLRKNKEFKVLGPNIALIPKIENKLIVTITIKYHDFIDLTSLKEEVKLLKKNNKEVIILYNHYYNELI